MFCKHSMGVVPIQNLFRREFLYSTFDAKLFEDAYLGFLNMLFSELLLSEAVGWYWFYNCFIHVLSTGVLPTTVIYSDAQ